ncbi:MAG: LamG-like jellyroll fold domain-containing protein [Planctomycetota bacterium]
MIAAALPLLLLASTAVPHDGPDPIGSWRLAERQVDGTRLTARMGADAEITGERSFVGGALLFDGETTRVELDAAAQPLPTESFCVEAWAAINTPTRWGGLFGTIQDNGNAETGWLLGYDDERFTFALSTAGANDGDGRLTYMRGATRYEEGRFHHVCATYDGATMRLWVDGQIDAFSTDQSGAILYPKSAPVVIGGYRDDDEDYLLHGRIHSVRLFDAVPTAEGVWHMFEHGEELTREAPHLVLDPEHRWLVQPYLQWATRDGMTIRWETSRPSTSVVEWATRVDFAPEDPEKTSPSFAHAWAADGATRMHEVRLTGLETGTAHYYRVRSVDDLGRELVSGVSSFQTAPEKDDPYAFVVISDTQGNPEVSGRIAQHAFGLRPNFVLHPGDLVSTGGNKEEWLTHFFSSMKPLLERVALFPVLGNHEQDARYYYDYMSLPDPEHHYTFEYGNTQFFMLDSNREVGPGSEQYRFLDRELLRSKAEWKIVCYHHPCYTSDEDDYGDTWHGPSTRGDLRTRELVTLFDAHGVDIVWNGHIHSYERTWPLRAGRATDPEGGTVYMITGGGGGSLETAGPIRPSFQNTVKHGHHFCYVAVNGRTLEMKAYDLEGRLFDALTIRK